MAFDSRAMYIDRGKTNDSVSEFQFASHSYKSVDDNETVIRGVDFFPPFLGSNEDNVKIGDFLRVLLPVGLIEQFIITGTSPLTVNFSNAVNIIASFTGPWTASPTDLIVTQTRINSLVKISVEGSIQASSSAVAINAPAGTIIAGNRPPFLTTTPIIVVVNSLSKFGRFDVLADGSLGIFTDAGNATFAGTGNEGFFNADISYASN